MITYGKDRPDIIRMDENSFSGTPVTIASEAVIRVILERICELSATMLQKGRDGIAGMWSGDSGVEASYAEQQVTLRANKLKQSLLNPIPEGESFNGFVSSGPKPLLFSGYMPDHTSHLAVLYFLDARQATEIHNSTRISILYGELSLLLEALHTAVANRLYLQFDDQQRRNYGIPFLDELLDKRLGFESEQRISDRPLFNNRGVHAQLSPDVLAIIGHTLMKCANGILLGNRQIKVKLLKLVRSTVGVADLEKVLRVMAVDKSNYVRRTVYAITRKMDWTNTRLTDMTHADNRAASVVPGIRWRVRSTTKKATAPEWSGAGTVTELMGLLNIKSPRQLAWLMTGGLKSGDQERTYKVWEIPKRTGGTRRIISPCDTLKWVQRNILRVILDKVPVSNSAHGFVRGRSIASNARAHVGAVLTVKFDLSDFFDRISYLRVRGLFISLGFPEYRSPGYESVQSRRHVHPSEVVGVENGQHFIRHEGAVATVLASLCCVRYSYEIDDAATPQGAPTSPAIANLLCRNMDHRIQGYVKSIEKNTEYAEDNARKAVYTRYADDITISFKKDPFENCDISIGRLKWAISEIAVLEGFPVNPKKFVVVRKGGRRLVTGLVVSDEKISVPRETVAMIRAVIYNCEKHGIEANRREKGAGFERWLRGMVAYINMARPDVGAKFRSKLVKLGLLKFYTARPKLHD